MSIFQEGPFQKIVGIGFPTTGFAVLALQGSGSGPGYPAVRLSANGMDLGDMFGDIATKYAKTNPPYKTSSTSSFTSTVTIWQMEALFSDGWAGMRAFIFLDDQSPLALAFPYENWIYTGSLFDLSTIYTSGHSGTLRGTTAAEIVAQMEAAGVFGTLDHRIGPVVYGPTVVSGTGTTWLENAMVLLNLTQLKKTLGTRDIEFTTDLPNGYSAQMFTFKQNPSLIPIGPNNTPGSTYPILSVAQKTESSSGEIHTVGPADFIVDTQTLNFV